MAVFSGFGASLGGASSTEQRFPNIEVFRERVIAEFQRQPGIRNIVVDLADPAKFSGIYNDKDEFEADLTNLFGYVNSYPEEDADAAIDRFVRSLVAPKEISEQNLVVVIRPLDYIEPMLERGLEPLYVQLTDDLVILFAADLPDSMRPVSQSDFPGKTIKDLKAIARANVSRWLPKVVNDRSLYYVEDNTLLSPSLILIDEFWDSIEGKYSDDVLIAMPRKDQLFLFDNAEPHAMQLARRMVEVTFEDGFDLLSPQLLRRHSGRFELISAP